jgi:hypothetical protein
MALPEIRPSQLDGVFRSIAHPGVFRQVPLDPPGESGPLDPPQAASILKTRCAPVRGVLFATAHLHGNWELSAFARLMSSPMSVVVR